jgi:DNA-binding NtrC family response regulator
MSLTPLGGLVAIDPAAARRRILDAVEASGGDRSKAATELGISHRQFYRLVSRLGLWPAIDRLCRVRQFPVVPGPPRKCEE